MLLNNRRIWSFVVGGAEITENVELLGQFQE